MIEGLIQKYGKQLISELIDTIVISGERIRNMDLIPLLVENKIITNRTKIIHIGYSYTQPRTWNVNRRVYEDSEHIHMLNIKNRKGDSLVFLKFTNSDLPQILEELNGTENINA